ncbi:MAG: GC-type dockerin domain-anchored protein, partial [Phycisphaerales bacterium]
ITGWHDELDANRRERDGGYAVTMWGASSICEGPTDMRMVFRDPANDRSIFDQSEFSTTFTQFEFDPSWRFSYVEEDSFFSRPIYRVSSTNRGFLDGFMYIMPAFGLATDPITQDIDARVPLPFTDEPGRRVFDADPTPAFTTVIAMDQGLTPIEAFVLTRSERSGAGTLHTLDIVRGEMSPIAPVPSPRGVASGLDGSVFVSSESSLIRYSPQAGGTFVPTGNLALPFPADAMTYDDETRELYLLSRDQRRMMRVSEGLALLENSPVPAEIELSADASIAVGADASGGAGPAALTIFVAESSGVAERSRDAAGRLVVASHSKLPGVSDPRSLQIGDDGALYAVDDNVVHAFERDGAGGWHAVDRPLAGERSGPVFRVGRGRSNHDEAIMDDINRLPPDDDGGKPDCRADLDLDGELTIFDFLEFQNLFGAGSTWADFDHDGELTLFDFLAYQNAFARGCP